MASDNPVASGGTLTRAEAAGLLKLTIKGLHQMCVRGAAPQPFKLGRSVRFHRAEFLAWIDAKCPRWCEWCEQQAGK